MLQDCSVHFHEFIVEYKERNSQLSFSDLKNCVGRLYSISNMLLFLKVNLAVTEIRA